jgi:hypothetical protein
MGQPAAQMQRQHVHTPEQGKKLLSTQEGGQYITGPAPVTAAEAEMCWLYSFPGKPPSNQHVLLSSNLQAQPLFMFIHLQTNALKNLWSKWFLNLSHAEGLTKAQVAWHVRRSSQTFSK